MTAKLVLQRPENTLQFMVDWCKDMQKKQEETKLKSKALYEGNKIDVYDEEPSEKSSLATKQKKKRAGSAAYGTSLLKESADLDQESSINRNSAAVTVADPTAADAGSISASQTNDT